MIPFEDIQIQLVDSPPVTADFMAMHLLSLVRGADAVLIVADLSEDTLLDDIDVVTNAFSTRHVQFVRDFKMQDRDHVLCRILANKYDAPQAQERLNLLEEMVAGRLEVLPMSCKNPESVSGLGRMIFQWLGIIRVYSKAPGKKVDMDRPYTVFPGQTVEDVCILVHKDFYENLKFARLWRGNTGPITVSRTEPVQDRDVLELHM
jgi:ribosome-interacting GTPase 1